MALIGINELLYYYLVYSAMASIDEMRHSLPGIAADQDQGRRTCDFDAVEKADSEYECELMIEALKKELSSVRVSRARYLATHSYRVHHIWLYRSICLCSFTTPCNI